MMREKFGKRCDETDDEWKDWLRRRVDAFAAECDRLEPSFDE